MWLAINRAKGALTTKLADNHSTLFRYFRFPVNFTSFLRNVPVVVWENIPPGPSETTTCQNLFSQMPGNTLLGCCFVNYIVWQTFSSDRLLDDTGSTFGRCRIHFWDMENRTGFCFLSNLLSNLLSKVNFISKPRTKIIAPKAHLQPNLPTTTVLFLGDVRLRASIVVNTLVCVVDLVCPCNRIHFLHCLSNTWVTDAIAW